MFTLLQLAEIVSFVAIGNVTNWNNPNFMVAVLVGAGVITELLFWQFPGEIPAPPEEQ